MFGRITVWSKMKNIKIVERTPPVCQSQCVTGSKPHTVITLNSEEEESMENELFTCMSFGFI